MPTLVPAVEEDEGPHETTGRGKYPRRRSGMSDWDGDEADDDAEAEVTGAGAGSGTGSGFRGYSRKTGYPPASEASYAPRDRDARVRTLRSAPVHRTLLITADQITASSLSLV